MDTDTIRAAKHAYRASQTFRQMAAEYGLNPGTWSDIVNGKPVSRDTENAARRALGLPPLPAQVPVDPCPSCGKVHHLKNCHGKAVRHVRHSPAQRWRDMPIYILSSALRDRKVVTC